MLDKLVADLNRHASPDKAAFYPRFFKTGPGEYGEGDRFMGATVPDCRAVAKKFRDISANDIKSLLQSPWHEQRLVALLIMVLQYQRADSNKQRQSYNLYLSQTHRINNWDLVDLSSRDIVGAYIYHHPDHLPELDRLAASDWLWDRRIAIISTFYFLMKDDPQPTLHIAEQLLPDQHDLIQKATGWMLREMGKRIDRQLLIDFIRSHYHAMPRTTLRYAIEHFSAPQRKQLLRGDFTNIQ